VRFFSSNLSDPNPKISRNEKSLSCRICMFLNVYKIPKKAMIESKYGLFGMIALDNEHK